MSKDAEIKHARDLGMARAHLLNERQEQARLMSSSADHSKQGAADFVKLQDAIGALTRAYDQQCEMHGLEERDVLGFPSDNEVQVTIVERRAVSRPHNA